VTFHASRPFGIGFVAGNKADSASGGSVATGFILSAGLTRVSLRIAVRGKEPQEGGPGEPAELVPPEFDPRILPKSLNFGAKDPCAEVLALPREHSITTQPTAATRRITVYIHVIVPALLLC